MVLSPVLPWQMKALSWQSWSCYLTLAFSIQIPLISAIPATLSGSPELRQPALLCSTWGQQKAAHEAWSLFSLSRGCRGGSLFNPPRLVVPFGEGPRRVGGLAAVGCAVGCSLLCSCSHGDRQMGIPACRGDQTARRRVCWGREHHWTGVPVRDLLGPQELGEAARFSTNCFQEILHYFVQNGDHSLPL